MIWLLILFIVLAVALMVSFSTIHIFILKSRIKTQRDWNEYVLKKKHNHKEQEILLNAMSKNFELVNVPEHIKTDLVHHSKLHPVNKQDDSRYKPQVVTFGSSLESLNDYQETLTERRLKAFYKLALQVLDDDNVDLDEAKKLRTWLRRYPESKDDSRTKKLYLVTEAVLEDRQLDKDESLELFALLSEFCDQYEDDFQIQIKAEIKKPKKKLKIEAPQFIEASNEGDIYPFLNTLENGHEYFLEYADSKGKISERNIIFRSVDTNQSEQPYIKAVCTLRHKVRTFRVDRIRALVDLNTGEAFV